MADRTAGMADPKFILMSDLVAACDCGDLAGFQRSYGEAFLVYSGKQDDLRPAAQTWQPTVNTKDRLVGAGAPEQLARILIFPVRSRSPERWMVTVGRGEPNEIIIPDETISVYHAEFRRSAEGSFQLRDAGSTNGTFVNDKRVLPKPYGRPVRIRSSSSIRFGAVILTFLLAEELFDLIRTLAAVHRTADTPRPSNLQSSELFGDLPPSSTGKAPLSDALVAVLEAVQLLEAERYPLAIRMLEQIIASEPHNRDAQIWLHIAEARQLRQRGDTAAAVAHYRTVLELVPDHPEALAMIRALQGGCR